jgi:bifunctional UDP-N-acetylglucosamine pyrophosphorylase / glucosamine-1-phosphate N-acetyltransferase
MSVCAVIPAAGRGSRLGLDLPKLLAPIGPQLTIWSVLKEKILPFVDHIHVVLSPAGAPLFGERLGRNPDRAKISTSIQAEPRGMGDAIFGAASAWRSSETMLVIWGDQVHISAETLRASIALHHGDHATVALPLVPLAEPYVEYVFEADALTAIRQSREGDHCAPGGLGDVGTFVLSTDGLGAMWSAYLEQAASGAQTGEVNFLPFLVFLSRAGWRIRPHRVSDPDEARGINTPEDLEFFRSLYRKEQQRA